MRTSIFCLVLLAALPTFGQESADLIDKAPPEVDQALRARVDKFYGAFVAGKFKEAYMLVADDSQDKFFELSKEQYKGCEVTKTRYTPDFKRAVVVTSCKGDFRWNGVIMPTTFPLASNWEIVDGEWYWHYVKPTMVRSPFSPTGYVPVPQDGKSGDAPVLPKDITGTAKSILANVTVDKGEVHLHSYENSQDVIHVKNDMPGAVKLDLDKLDMPGLKITVGKATLLAHEETTIVFEWRLDDPALLCVDCAKKMSGNPTVRLHIVPTAQIFPLNVIFENRSTPAAGATPAAGGPPAPGASPTPGAAPTHGVAPNPSASPTKAAPPAAK